MTAQVIRIDRCQIDDCTTAPTDLRSPIWLRNGETFTVCTPHWNAIMRVMMTQVDDH